MRHELSQKFFAYWEAAHLDGAFPALTEFTADKFPEFEKYGQIFKLQRGDIVLEFTGRKNAEDLTSDLVGRPITDLFPNALKPLQMSLLMPCIRQGIGMVRFSRMWYGHRHKDVEWLLLPVMDTENSQIALVGLSLTFVAPDKRDYVTVGSALVERIIRQNFLSFGRKVDVGAIDSHSWAVLDTMGAEILIDGLPVDHMLSSGVRGEAGMLAAKVSHANVLAVAEPTAFGRILSRLGGRYNLKLVSSFEEASAILRSDMIDILVTAETVGKETGLKLVQEAQALSAFTACVMMLDPRDEAKDTRVIEGGKFVQCLVKPVGEFALRQALDDASDHVNERRKETFDRK